MRAITAIFLLLCVSCGSSGTPTAEHPEVASNDPSVSPATGRSKRRSLPDHCAHGKRECVPPPGWVQRLCEDVYPDVALNMFKPGTRWKRLYMLARADPFNASGGASLLGDKLERGEEVIALKRRDNNGEMQVGYFNPRPIKVGRAEAFEKDGKAQMYLELRDVNYPGSYYSLAFNPATGLLAGIYFQAVLRETYEVEFVRLR